MADPVSPHDDENPWTQRSFMLAGGLVAIIALLAVVLTVTGSDEDPTAPAPQQPREALSPSASAGGDSACGLAAGSEAVPTNGLPDTEWQLVGSMAAPTAPEEHGPARSNDGFRTCFARSPTGALYAAVNFWATATDKPDAEVLRRLAADTEVRADAIADARRDDGASLDEAGPLQVVGFNFTSWSPQSASLDLAFRLQNGGLLRLPTAMRWQEGDWKYVIPPGGDPGGGELRGLAGYVAWSGA